MAGQIGTADGATFYAAVWQNSADGAVTTSAFCREKMPPSPPASTTAAKWWETTLTPVQLVPGFIWKDGMMTDLNTLIAADSTSS